MTKHAMFLLALTVTLGAAPSSAQRLRLVVGGASFRPFPVAAPVMHVDNATTNRSKRFGEEVTAVMQAGINLARSLSLVNPKSYLAPEDESPTKPGFQSWTDVGASGLVRGSAAVDGTKVKLTLYFYDVVARKQMLTRTYQRTTTTWRYAVHQFLDEVVAILTGEPGVLASRIAYVKRTPKGKAVYSCDVHGSNEVRMTEPKSLSLLPEWSKDGEAIFFTSYMKGNPDLFKLDLTSKKLDWVSHKRGINTGAAVSPDGKRIALTLSTDGNTEIYVMKSDGSNVKRLTNSWGQDVSPSWSPDGKQIVFVSSRSGNPHLYLMNRDGSDQRRLTFQGNYNQEPDWSPRPDGQIAFTARDERLVYDVFLVSPKTGEITRLTQNMGHNESPSFSPDGHHIVFTSTRSDRNKHLYIMDADGTKQRQISQTPGYYETPSWGPRASR